MYVLVVIACMTFDARTSCQEFERPHVFPSEQSCDRAGGLEKGRYARRAARRSWMEYSWACRDQGGTPVDHNRGRSEH
jgi:hypothetical protein